MPKPRPLSQMEIDILKWMRSRSYDQTATAIWRDGMFEGPYTAVRANLSTLARRGYVKSHGCSRTTLWGLTDKGRQWEVPA